jgi:hypothetical protein
MSSPVEPVVPTASQPPEPKNFHKTQPSKSTRPPSKARKKRRATSVSAEYIGRKDGAELVSVSVQVVDKSRRSGKLKTYRFGRRVLISRRELLALVESGIC